MSQKDKSESSENKNHFPALWMIRLGGYRWSLRDTRGARCDGLSWFPMDLFGVTARPRPSRSRASISGFRLFCPSPNCPWVCSNYARCYLNVRALLRSPQFFSDKASSRTCQYYILLLRIKVMIERMIFYECFFMKLCTMLVYGCSFGKYDPVSGK